MSAGRFAPVIVALTLSACGEDFNGPDPVSLRVSLTTVGIDRDPDGYFIIVGGRAAAVQPQGSVRFSLAGGQYEVTLDGLADNCSVNGADVVSVTVPPPMVAATHPAEVSFEVACYAASADLEVRVQASGRDFPPNGFLIGLTDGSTPTRTYGAPPNLALQITGLPAGSYDITLSGLTDNCTVSGPDTRTVSLTVGGLTRDKALVSFTVDCAATTGDIDIGIATTGAHLDDNGYTLVLDGTLLRNNFDYYGYSDGFPVRFPVNGHSLLPADPGSHTLELTNIASNCSVTPGPSGGPNPATVSVTAGAVSAVRFSIVCS